MNECKSRRSFDQKPLSSQKGVFMNNLTVKKLRYWICDFLCPDRFFNEDASQEIDRLTHAVEKLKKHIQQLEAGNE